MNNQWRFSIADAVGSTNAGDLTLDQCMETDTEWLIPARQSRGSHLHQLWCLVQLEYRWDHPFQEFHSGQIAQETPSQALS